MTHFTTILRGTVGSTSYGLGIEGQDDRDEMGVAIEPLRSAYGIKPTWEHMIYRTAEERDGKGARSRPGDLDLTVYSLRKYLRLALKGNPSVLVLLYLPDELLQNKTVVGQELQDLAPQIVSKKALHAFYGYLSAQEQKLKGERGTRVHRPELVEKYGYDTKFAMHALRLGIQGLELAQTGKLTMPLDPQRREFLRNVRTGVYNLEHVLSHIDLLKGGLKQETQTFNMLREEPDTEAVEEWMLRKYQEAWA
jgi:predicted nucleotidyltransferase